MPLPQLFALSLGVVYLLIGVLGFVPPVISGDISDAFGPLKGQLLGVFAINLWHSIVHVLIGAYGLLAYRSFAASRGFTLVVGIAYALVFLIGILTRQVAALGGLLPLNAADNVLHLITASAALVIYFTSRGVAARASGASR